MFSDLLFGLRLLRKEKGFAAAALLTLALCIGANTAIFTVLDAVVLRSLPFRDPERLVIMYNLYPGVGVTEQGSNAVVDYIDRRKLTDAFSEMTVLGSSGYDIGSGESARRITGEYVTPSYFRVLDVQPLLGRTFTEDEAVQGKDKVAVLSQGLWRDLFGSDPAVLGRDVRLSGVQYKVVGVVPDRTAVLTKEARIWVPFAFTPQQTSDDARHGNNWNILARLKPGVSLQYAQSRVDALNRANMDRFPQLKPLLISTRFHTKVVGLQDELIRYVRPTLYLLQGAVALVLLIGCVNLANLMLVRSNVRLKEMAVRFSLGAGRWRIARQLLTESVLLSVIGGALGIAVGYGGVRLLTYLGAADMPRGSTIAIDSGVLGFTALTAIVTGLAFGSVPIFHLFRRDLNDVFRGNQRSGTAGRHALSVRSTLVVCQVALAFILLIGAGLLTFTFMRLLTVDPGFRAANVITAEVTIPRSRYKDDGPARTFFVNLVQRLQAIPGVRSAGVTTFLPFSNNNNSSVITIAGHPLAPGENPPVPGWNSVSPGYLPAMGIKVVEGRNFADSDTETTPNVCLIDEHLARRYWPNGGAIGHKIVKGLPELDKDGKAPSYTIIGVVRSVKTGNLGETSSVGQVYFNFRQDVYHSAHIVVLPERNSPGLFSVIRRELQQVDPEMPLVDAKTMTDRVATSLVNNRAAMVLCLIFGALALLLSAIGLYGVLAYTVTQRTRELGIRVALGANSQNVLGLVVGQGLRLAAAGLALGAAASFAVTRLMASLLFGVKPADPGVFAMVAALLATVTIGASLIPSIRAVRIQPSNALRHE